jgi:hypothetical protein
MNDSYSTVVVTCLVAALISFSIFPSARTRRAIRNYYEQHQLLIQEAETLNSSQTSPSQPTIKPDQVQLQVSIYLVAAL